MNGSPPFSLTTNLPARACAISTALMCSCAMARPRGTLAASMISTSGGSSPSSDRGREPVGDDHVGLGEQLPAAHGYQPRVARPAADQRHPGRRSSPPWPPGPRRVQPCGAVIAPEASAPTIASLIPALYRGSPLSDTDPDVPGRPEAGVRRARRRPVVGPDAPDPAAASASAATAALTAGSLGAGATSQEPAQSPGGVTAPGPADPACRGQSRPAWG